MASFGDQLELFSLSVDVIGKDRFGRAAKMIHDYCHDTLEIQSTLLFEATRVDGKSGLKQCALDSFDHAASFTLKTADGEYSSQAALAFQTQKPLWVVSAEGKKLLDSTRKYTDKWSKLTVHPRFRAMTGSPGAKLDTRTSILVPIFNGHESLGVLNFNSSEYIDITDTAKVELTKIASAVGHLMALKDSDKSRRTRTENALHSLQQTLAGPQPRLTKPKIFLASSHKADKDVIMALLEVLKSDGYSDVLEVIYWKDMHKPGNITTQLLTEIGRCRYAVCYFSQRTKDGHYFDNPNVLFEAGMFHGRIDEISNSPCSWIPIREKTDYDAPFDFAQERMIVPPRLKSGTLSKTAFAAEFRKSLNAMLAVEGQ